MNEDRIIEELIEIREFIIQLEAKGKIDILNSSIIQNKLHKLEDFVINDKK